jgi:hypothetical protein
MDSRSVKKERSKSCNPRWDVLGWIREALGPQRQEGFQRWANLMALSRVPEVASHAEFHHRSYLVSLYLPRDSRCIRRSVLLTLVLAAMCTRPNPKLQGQLNSNFGELT